MRSILLLQFLSWMFYSRFSDNWVFNYKAIRSVVLSIYMLLLIHSKSSCNFVHQHVPSLKREGVRRTEGQIQLKLRFKTRRNLQQHTGQLFKNHFILEPKNRKPQTLQMGGSFGITLLCNGIKMHLPIQFNNQLFSRAIKIHNIAVNAMLSPEFSSM